MSNPLLDDIKKLNDVDIVSISLPTKGIFYDDGVLDADADPSDLPINAIGIMAELSTRDPFILASGKGMELLIPQVCPAVLKPNQLAEIDLEAILLAARIATHGNMIVVEHTCNNMVKTEAGKEELCGEENKIDVNLYNIIQRYEPIEFSDKFVVEIPDYNQKVFLRPIQYGQALGMIRETLSTRSETKKLEKTGITELLTDETKIDEYASIVMKQAITTMESIIHSIFYVESDGGRVYDSEKIKEWLLAISKENVKKIISGAGDLSKTFQGKNAIKYECSACGNENNTNIELDIQKLFFFTPLDSKQQKKPSSTSRKRKSPKTKP